MSDETTALVRRDVRRRFERAAADFDNGDFLHRATATGVLERMLPINFAAQRIVDLGCATGQASRALAKRYRNSRIVSVDLAAGMLQKARAGRSRWARITEVQADARALPFADGSVDAVFANLLLPWIDDLAAGAGEIARVLRQGGLFAFSTLGPGSLLELRHAWQSVDGLPHVNHFPDMHDLGDALLHGGLCDPVLDIDYLTVKYRNVASLYRDLSRVGGRNSLGGRRRSLTPKGDLAAVQADLEGRFRDATLSVQLEIVYGHAWGGGPVPPPGEYHLDVAQVGRRRR